MNPMTQEQDDRADSDLLLSILQEDLASSPERVAEASEMAEAQERWNALKKATPPYMDILWAYDHLQAGPVGPQSCPTRGAWALLQFGRDNQKDFLTRLLPQATAEQEKRRQEKLTREREAEQERKAREEAEARKKEPPLPEKEARAIADIRAMLETAIREAVDGKV